MEQNLWKGGVEGVGAPPLELIQKEVVEGAPPKSLLDHSQNE